jgi:hypothetical protein
LAFSKAELRLTIPIELPPVHGGDSDAASGKIPIQLVSVFIEARQNFIF